MQLSPPSTDLFTAFLLLFLSCCCISFHILLLLIYISPLVLPARIQERFCNQNVITQCTIIPKVASRSWKIDLNSTVSYKITSRTLLSKLTCFLAEWIPGNGDLFLYLLSTFSKDSRYTSSTDLSSASILMGSMLLPPAMAARTFWNSLSDSFLFSLNSSISGPVGSF